MLIVKGKVVSREVRHFDYTDKKTGKLTKGTRATVFILDGGRPIEVAVHENDQFKEGQTVELPVFVSAYVTRAGGAGYRLVKVRAE